MLGPPTDAALTLWNQFQVNRNTRLCAHIPVIPTVFRDYQLPASIALNRNRGGKGIKDPSPAPKFTKAGGWHGGIGGAGCLPYRAHSCASFFRGEPWGLPETSATSHVSLVYPQDDPSGCV